MRSRERQSYDYSGFSPQSSQSSPVTKSGDVFWEVQTPKSTSNSAYTLPIPEMTNRRMISRSDSTPVNLVLMQPGDGLEEISEGGEATKPREKTKNSSQFKSLLRNPFSRPGRASATRDEFPKGETDDVKHTPLTHKTYHGSQAISPELSDVPVYQHKKVFDNSNSYRPRPENTEGPLKPRAFFEDFLVSQAEPEPESTMPWRTVDTNEDSGQDRKIPRTLRGSRNRTERSNSPGFRTSGILPTLATLMPGTSNLTGGHQGVLGVRKSLGLRSRSSSRGNIKEDLATTPGSNDDHDRGRRRSSSIATMIGQPKNRGRSAGGSSHHALGHGGGVGNLTFDSISPRSRTGSEGSLAPSPTTTSFIGGRSGSRGEFAIPPSDKDQSLRHPDLPVASWLPQEKDKVCFMRVYKSDGTFGTIACPLETSAERLLQLAARKFFINDARDYHLVALYPDRVRIISGGTEPALLIRNLLISAGYSSDMDQLNAVCRDDTSFLCRIVLSNINEPLRPLWLMQSRKELIMTNTDVTDAPSLACADPARVESMDLSRSSFEGTTLTFPRLTKLRMSSMSLPSVATMVQIMPGLTNLMANLTMLDLSGNGFDKLDELDLKSAPNLRHLDLRGNNLQELPSSLLYLPYLQVLRCGSNALTSFGCWNPSLREIDLSYNKFRVLKISQEVAVQMVNLVSLQLCANCLSEIPEHLSLLPSLKSLDVRHNKIIRPLDGLPQTLETLVCAYNKPEVLKHRDSSSNVPSSQEVSDCSGMLNIRDVILESVHSLTLPEEFRMSRVTKLNLRNNHLPFVHESLFRTAVNLEVLNLSNNHLTKIPSSVKYLQKLEELSVANNVLIDLPTEVFELPELRILDVHGNNLKSVASQMFFCSKIKSLNLASNLLTNLPLVNPGSSSLVHLVLTDNQLSEDCFETISQFTGLQILDLAYNFLTEIPSGLFLQLPSLEELHLAGNRLVALPRDDFVHATQLRVLCVNSNRLHTLPAELSKATNLEVLDASANQLRYNVANWPFDWNWRWNKKLRYLNFSSNKRLEIRKSHQYVAEEAGVVDLADFCTLPNLATLGLMDVTLTTNAIPFQSDTCRVRTFGSDMNSKYRVGIADSLGFRPLANNDLVLERFRNRENESLIALFDGQSEWASGGNKISHLAQETFGAILKRELEVNGQSDVDALRNAFLGMHREIGNIALMSPAEVSHTTLGHLSATASRLVPSDRASGTGATVLYIKGNKFYIATVGGASVVLSRANGTYSVLSKPLPPVAAELDRIRSAGGIVDPSTSYVNNVSPYPRMIGCYTSGTVFSAAPTIYEYEGSSFDPSDQIIIGTKSLWQYMRYETAADICRSSAHDPVLAAMKIRDFAIAYGCRDRMMTIVLGKPQDNPAVNGQRHSNGDLYDNEFGSLKKRRQPLPEDSTLARLGSEVSPPFGEVTMVFTDIKSSTYLWENYPSVMRSAIKTHNSLMRRSIRLMDGYEVKNEGDAFIVSFHNPVKALIWCLTVQQHLLTAEWPPELLEVDECKPVQDDAGVTIFRGLSVRMGIHCGRPVAEPDPVTRRMDYFGPMVNRASRISGIALGGQISVSTDFLNMLNRALRAHKLVQEGVPVEEAFYFTSPSSAIMLDRSVTVLDHTEYVIKELGELKLRGIENPEHIFNVYPAALASRKAWYEERHDEEQQAKSSMQDQILVNQQLQLQLQQQQLIEQRRASQASTHVEDQLNQSFPSGSDEVAAAKGLPTISSFVDNFNTVEGWKPGSQTNLENEADGFNGLITPPEQEDRRPSAESLSSLVSSRSRSSDHMRRESWSRGSSFGGLRPPGFLAKSTPLEVENGDPLQSIAIRLEAICATLTESVTSLESALQTLNLIEPAVPEGSELAISAQSVWMTRIENAIGRLQQFSHWP